MIQSFGNRETELVFLREPVPKLDPRIHKSANKKLHQLDAAVSLDSLRVPPGNRLEALKGDRKGTFSIRVNDQWRITFRWKGAGPEHVTMRTTTKECHVEQAVPADSSWGDSLKRLH